MPAHHSNQPFRLGLWHVDPASCRLTSGDQGVNLEPKVMDFLVLLVESPGEVLSRDEIFSQLWPGVTVGEDTLARVVSKLRKALGDNSKTPTYVETISKRGYRLIKPVEGYSPETQSLRAAPSGWLQSNLRVKIGAFCMIAMVIVMAVTLNWFTDDRDAKLANPPTLTTRADDFYMRFTRADNEAAIALYERAIAENPSNASAQAGLANALVQRVVRWPNAPDEPNRGATSLSAALEAGITETATAHDFLSRAQALAERAVRVAPSDPTALKAVGLVYSAQGDFDRAISAYEQAVKIDDNAWAPMINLGEIYQIRGDKQGSINYFVMAYDAMERVYVTKPHHVGPWHAALGVVIGEGYEALGQIQEAEIWYRRILVRAPFEPEATVRLAHIVADAGDKTEADRLCRTLIARIGAQPECTTLISAIGQVN